MKRRDLMKLAGSALAAVGVPVALAGKAEAKELEKCRACGQPIGTGVGGEYPCAHCGTPMLHDPPILLAINTPDPASFQRSAEQIQTDSERVRRVVARRYGEEVAAEIESQFGG